MWNRKGRVFVISAPSGSGKTTLCEKLIQGLGGKRKLVRSVSATTRKARRGERQGRDYFFISKGEFIKRRKARRFLEWARVLGSFYGTPREFVRKHIDCGADVLLSIDVEGAMKIKRKTPRAVFIFILPPSFCELEKRLKRRSTESKREIIRRLKLAEKEMGFVEEYDYVVLNDKLKPALKELKRIVRRERNDKRCHM